MRNHSLRRFVPLTDQPLIHIKLTLRSKVFLLVTNARNENLGMQVYVLKSKQGHAVRKAQNI